MELIAPPCSLGAIGNLAQRSQQWLDRGKRAVAVSGRHFEGTSARRWICVGRDAAVVKTVHTHKGMSLETHTAFIHGDEGED